MPSGKGMFGSILGGVVMGALAGAHAARPGGIPSHELGGGAGQGAEAAAEMLKQRDERARGQAQQNFQNQQVAKKQQNEDLMYQADLHIKDLNQIKLAHEIAEAQRNEPFTHAQLVNSATAASLQLENEAKNLGLINPREYADYSEIPKADQDKFVRGQVKLVTLPDGKVRVYDRTFDARTTPNSADFEVKDLVGLDPKTGKPEWKTVGHVKAGAGTAAQQEAELDKERTQLQASATSNATIEKEKAQAEQAGAAAELSRSQAKLMKTMGVDVPPGYRPPADAFKMDATTLQSEITKSGVTAPPDFQTLYAIGHYDADLKTLTTNPRKGMPVRDQNSALSYIRTFVNPNYDAKNYDAVKNMEKEFASTRQGTAGGNLLSFNAAIGHLGQLYKASQALQNQNLTYLNTLANQVGAKTGKDPLPVYNAVRSVLVGEAARLFKQAAPDIQEMKEISTALDSSNSPDQFKGVAGMFAHTFLTKGEQQIWQYYNYTGKLPPSTFNPNTVKTLQDLGIDVSKSFPEGAQVAVGGTANQAVRQLGASAAGGGQLKNLHTNGTVTIGQNDAGQWIDQATGQPYVAPTGGRK
jgi:hypothetical protein